MPALHGDRYRVPTALWLLAAAVTLAASSAQAKAAEPELKIGEHYTLLLRRGDVTLTPSGTLIQATPHWLVLDCVEVSSSVTGLPYLMDLPWVGRLFQVEHQQLMGQHAWIPREAATIGPDQRVTKLAGGKPIADLDPPMNLRCMVHVMEEGKMAHRFGKLVALDDNQLVLARTYDDPASAPRLTIRRQDVLAIEFEAYPLADGPGQAGK